MAEDLIFPRIIYRGAPDTLGRGPHAHDETGELVGDTKRCDAQDQLDADLKAGWRLTRELDDPAGDESEAEAGDDAADVAGPRRKAKAKK